VSERITHSLPFWIFLFWGVDLLFLSRVPLLRWMVDPLLLLLIFLGFRLPSGRFLWLIGMGLGFLRDLGTGSLLGGFACTFALIGWILNSTRHLVEREDPLVQGIVAGILSGASGILFGGLLTLADPAVGWNRWVLWILPVAMGVNGICAALGFPRLQQILR